MQVLESVLRHKGIKAGANISSFWDSIHLFHIEDSDATLTFGLIICYVCRP